MLTVLRDPAPANAAAPAAGLRGSLIDIQRYGRRVLPGSLFRGAVLNLTIAGLADHEAQVATGYTHHRQSVGGSRGGGGK